jgi:hypothetical protein
MYRPLELLPKQKRSDGRLKHGKLNGFKYKENKKGNSKPNKEPRDWRLKDGDFKGFRQKEQKKRESKPSKEPRG